MKDIVVRIEKNTSKKPKIKHKPQIERDPLTNTILQEILNDQKPKSAHLLSWSKFKLVSLLMFYAGLRVGETANLTKEDVESLMVEGKCSIFQSKVNKLRTIVGINSAKKQLQKFKDTIDFIFKDHDKLYPYTDKKERIKTNKWAEITNKFLEIDAQRHNKELKTHSLRINYVTQLLRTTTTHRAQQIVGHTDIRSTMRYNRYFLTKAEKLQDLETAFLSGKDSD